MGKKLFIQLVKKAHKLTKSMKGQYTCSYREQYSINFKELVKEFKEFKKSQIVSTNIEKKPNLLKDVIIINPTSKKKNVNTEILAIVDNVNYISYTTKDMAEFLAREMGFKGDIKKWITKGIPKKYQDRVKCFKKLSA